MWVNLRIVNALLLVLLALVSGCRSGEKLSTQTVPHSQPQQIAQIEVYYEATPVASKPEEKPKPRFKLAAFRSEEKEGPFQKLSKPKKESDSYQVWSHATIHLQYPHPHGKKEYVLSTIKVQRETPPRMFDENRPAPIKTQLNKIQRTSNPNWSLFKLASSSKTNPQHPKKSEYEIWTLDIPLSDVSEAFHKLANNSSSIKYSDKGNARLHWQHSYESRVSMRCNNLPFIEKIIQRTYHEGQLAGFRFD